MDTRRYNKIVNNNRVELFKTRRQFNVGVNSPESTCNKELYFLAVETAKPVYLKATHKLVESWVFANNVDTKTYTLIEKTFKEQELYLISYKKHVLNTLRTECKAYIYSYWSIEAQSNVAMGLYPQNICEICRNEIRDLLSENKTFINTVKNLATVLEIDTYINSITRLTITGKR